MFINRILGCILLGLVSAFPYINWYFTMHFTVCIVSIFVLSKTFIDKFTNYGIFISVVVVAVSMETLYWIQFTKTASLAMVAGTIGLLYSLRNKKDWLITAVCIFLILMSSMIRMESLKSVIPFLGIVFLYEMSDMLKNRKELIMRSITTLCICLLLLLSCYAAGELINKNTPGSDEFYRYNNSRFRLTDYKINNDNFDDANAEAFMVAFWMNNDPEILTLERVEELSERYGADIQPKGLTETAPEYIKWIGKMLTSEAILPVSVFITAYVLLFSKRKFYVVPILCCFFGLEWYLVSIGRYAHHRVDFGILLALSVSLLYLSEIQSSKSDEKRVIIRNVFASLAVVSAIAYLCAAPIGYSRDYLDYYRALRASLIKASSDEEYKYMIHPKVYEVDGDRKIYDIPECDFANRFYFIGGWQHGSNIPGNEESTGGIIGNAWEQCIDSDTIRVIMPSDEGESLMDVVEWYIEEDYGRSVESILVYQDDYVAVFRIVSTNAG